MIGSAALWIAAGGTLAALAPTPLSLGPVRASLTPLLASGQLSGLSPYPHVALTFDDGPDPRSTPAFLALLDDLEVRATFFVLGRHLGDRHLLREMATLGHEIGVHGWDHRPAVLHAPGQLRDGIRRTRSLVEDVTGERVRWYRPPYGICSPASSWAARSAGLTTVLWSAWGRDWEHRATPHSVADTVTKQLQPGGTVLLHDSDRTSALGSWRTTLRATELLVPRWRHAGLEVGPLSEHWRTATAPAALAARQAADGVGAVMSTAGWPT